MLSKICLWKWYFCIDQKEMSEPCKNSGKMVFRQRTRGKAERVGGIWGGIRRRTSKMVWKRSQDTAWLEELIEITLPQIFFYMWYMARYPFEKNVLLMCGIQDAHTPEAFYLSQRNNSLWNSASCPVV